MANTLRPAWLVAALAVVIAAALMVAYQQQQPVEFELRVINRSELPVQQVRLFGEALEQDALLLNLDPGQQAKVTTLVGHRGALKFEVSQSGNRIDTFIVEDTRLLDNFRQTLVIHPHNRFILSHN